MRAHERARLLARADVGRLVDDDAVDQRLSQLPRRHGGVAADQGVAVAQAEQHRLVAERVPAARHQADEPVPEEVDRVAEALERRGRRVVDLSPPLDRRKVGADVRAGRATAGRAALDPIHEERGLRPLVPPLTWSLWRWVITTSDTSDGSTPRALTLRGDAALGDPVLHRHLPEDDAERSRGIGRDRRVVAGVDQEGPLGRVLDEEDRHRYHCAGRVNDPSSVRATSPAHAAAAGAR